MSTQLVTVRIVVEDQFELDTDWYEGDTLEECMDEEAASIETDPFPILESPTATINVTVEADC